MSRLGSKSKRPRANHALQPVADRAMSLRMTASTLKLEAQLGPISGG